MLSSSMLPATVFGLETGALIAVVMFGGGGVVALWWGTVNFRDGYEMWSHEPVDAAAVRHESGVVEVSGSAKPLDGTVTAPYSDEDCLAYEYRLKEKRHDAGDDDNTADWRTVDRGEERVPFVVEDATGRVAVDPEGADVSMDDEDYSSSTRTRQIEGRLDVGEDVHVFGHRREDGAPGDESVYVGDGGEVNFRVADTSGGRAVLRLLAKGAGAMVFGAIFVGVAGYVVTTGMP